MNLLWLITIACFIQLALSFHLQPPKNKPITRNGDGPSKPISMVRLTSENTSSFFVDLRDKVSNAWSYTIENSKKGSYHSLVLY